MYRVAKTGSRSGSIAQTPLLCHNNHKQYYQYRGPTITPLQLTRFWHRRLCLAVVFAAVVILGLYGWAQAHSGVHTLGDGYLISGQVAIMSALTAAASLFFLIWVPKKWLFGTAFGVYLLLIATIGYLIVTSGGTGSPFTLWWIFAALFAGIFGSWGIVPLFIAVGSYMIAQYVGPGLGRDGIITLVLIGDMPLLASYLVWHQQANKESHKDKAYRELATELSQVANKAEVVINAIADGVIAVNSQGIIQLINPAAQQIIGWGKQDALALNYKSVLKLADKDGNELPPATDPVAQTLATNKQATTDAVYLVTNSQKKLLVSVIVSPVGQLGSGVIVVFRDITKEKAEEREQAEFISTASHEMRTPVASIEGYLGLALNPATAQIDDKARDFINKAHEAAQHLGRLFQDLLDVSKAEDGRLSNNPKVINVVEFTHDIVEGLRPQAEAKGLRILFKPIPDTDERGSDRRVSPVFYVNVDNDHLREVTANLVENAIKYTPQGDVVIDVNGDAEHVTISVADSGIGIPKEDQAHLFQKFYRVDNSDTREIGGTGLGLYLSRRLTEAMNGRIWVDSEYKKGSTFYIELDRMSHEDATHMIEEAANAEPEPQPARPLPLPTVASVAPAASAPPTPPLYQPTPAPQPAVPVPQSPLRTTPTSTPLSVIEQNTDQYLRSSRERENMTIPPRRQ